MNEDSNINQAHPPCPKRYWVMEVLADDELHSPGEPLPAGLRFHLDRCPSCKGLAERLQDVTETLAAASCEMPAGLVSHANERATAVLAGEVEFSGRIAPEAIEEYIEDQPGHTWLRGAARYALAASIVFAFVMLGWTWQRQSTRSIVQDRDASENRVPPPEQASPLNVNSPPATDPAAALLAQNEEHPQSTRPDWAASDSPGGERRAVPAFGAHLRGWDTSGYEEILGADFPIDRAAGGHSTNPRPGPDKP